MSCLSFLRDGLFGRANCRGKVTVVENFIQDIRFALRTFLKNPGFALLAILTLALGIGANTAIFTVLDAVLLRSLPVAHPSELVVLTNPDAHGMSVGSESGDRSLLAYSEFEYLRDHQEVFSGIFAADSTLAQIDVTIPDASKGSEAASGTAQARRRSWRWNPTRRPTRATARPS